MGKAKRDRTQFSDEQENEESEMSDVKKAKVMEMAAQAAHASSSSSSSSSGDNNEEEEVADEDADLSWFLQNLHLRKILKENHGNSINGVILNKYANYSSGMVATFSNNQVNFYDNVHLGEHLDPALHFINQTTEYTKGGEVFAGSFLRPRDQYELLFAFGGADQVLSILSIADGKVVRYLEGHEGRLSQIVCHPNERYVVASLSDEDRTVRLWDVWNGHCFCRLQLGFEKPECIVFHPDRLSLWVSGDGSQIAEYDVEGVIQQYKQQFMMGRAKDEQDGELEGADEGRGSYLPTLYVDVERVSPELVEVVEFNGMETPHGNGSTIDHFMFVEDDESLSVLSKDLSGVMHMWNPESPKERTMFSAKIPNACRTKMDISSENEYVAVGNGTGTILLYDLSSPGRTENPNLKMEPPLHEVQHRRSAKNPVNAVQFGTKDRQLLMVAKESILLRFDYLDPKHFDDEED